MGFVPVSIDEYIKIHLGNNPTEREEDLRKCLEAALANFIKGDKCACGNDIWVIGSAFAGTSCFACITGESEPDNDFEIDLAMERSMTSNEFDIEQLNGFFDDNGVKINPELIKKPSLCLICMNDGNPDEEILCQMTRYDQRNDQEFICYAFKKRSDI